MTDWNDVNEGITLGPEDALEREIARSKALKVERLQLRDRVETLEARVRVLTEQCDALRRQQNSPTAPQPGTVGGRHGARSGRGLPAGWAVFLLIFNLAALAGLLIYFGQR